MIQRTFFDLEGFDDIEEDDPGPAELIKIDGFCLRPEEAVRFLEVRRLRRLFDPTGSRAVRWSKSGEACPGLWMGSGNTTHKSSFGTSEATQQEDEI